MAGPSVLALPYAFYNSGLFVGILVSFLTYVASLRTCIYIKRTTEPDGDYFDTLKKYWGPNGFRFYYGGVIILYIVSVCGYFIIMT